MKRIILILILNLTIVLAQDRPKKLYTLKDCIKISSQNNYDIILSKALIENVAFEKVQAFGNYLPTVDFNMGYSRILTPETSYDPNNFNMNIGANWVIFDGLAREARFSAANSKQSSTIANSHFTNLYILKQVYNAYIEVVKSSQIVKIRREDLSLTQKDLEKTKAMYEAGSIPITEIYAQEANIGQKEIEIVRAENVLVMSKGKLFIVMGMTPDTEAEFDENSIPSFISEDDIQFFRRNFRTFNDALQIALNNRNDLKSINYDFDYAEDALNIARSSYYPRLSATGGWVWSNNKFTELSNKGTSTVGLNLNVPLFTNFATDYNVENAKLSLLQVDIEKQKLLQQIKYDVQMAFNNLESSEKQIEISQRTVKSAELNYNSMRERYNVGSATITELTFANNQYIVAQINRVATYYEYINAQKELLFAVGTIE